MWASARRARASAEAAPLLHQPLPAVAALLLLQQVLLLGVGPEEGVHPLVELALQLPQPVAAALAYGPGASGARRQWPQRSATIGAWPHRPQGLPDGRRP